jgi:hypothetical protein
MKPFRQNLKKTATPVRSVKMSLVPPTEPPLQGSTEQSDSRLYLPDHDGWVAAIKRDWNKEYCFSQKPGENHYHLLLSGEIYLERGGDKFCLNCALRHGVLTRERTYWQKGPSSVPDTPISLTTDDEQLTEG